MPYQCLVLKLQSLGLRIVVEMDLLLSYYLILTGSCQWPILRVALSGLWSPTGIYVGTALVYFVDNIELAVQTSSLRLFADDVCLYAQISFANDCLKLQDDLSCIYSWSAKWQLNLNPPLILVTSPLQDLILFHGLK